MEGKKMKKNKHTGSNFHDFLKEEGMIEEVQAMATKKILIMELLEAMEEMQINKSQMAKEMHTSRSVVNNLLDDKNATLKLITLQKAANILGRKLVIKLT
ncbi:MAG: Fis family transcriptional regulator [Verrucomicrobia bacterium]|nr:MAG: Fis family transcriptional regulator [Verrucomicrobiota bacterium]